MPIHVQRLQDLMLIHVQSSTTEFVCIIVKAQEAPVSDYFLTPLSHYLYTAVVSLAGENKRSREVHSKSGFFFHPKNYARVSKTYYPC